MSLQLHREVLEMSDEDKTCMTRWITISNCKYPSVESDHHAIMRLYRHIDVSGSTVLLL